MKPRDRVLTGLVIAVIVLISARVALPFIAKDFINERLANMDGYTGQVDDVDIALYRGAYALQGLQIVKRTSGGDTEPFLSGETIDFSVQWGALLQGSIVGEVELLGLDMRVIGSEDDSESQTGEEVDWRTYLEEFVPFRLNQILIRDSAVSFRAPVIEMEDALRAEQVNGYIRNITNSAEVPEEAFAHYNINAMVLDAPLTIEGRVDPNVNPPLFDVNMTLQEVSLPAVNPWFEQFLNVDAQGGSFELYLEMAAADGAFEGYAKPIMKDVDFFDLDESTENFFQGVWEGLVDLAAELFENQSEDQVAAEIPFSGSIDDPNIGTFAGAVSILRNAFLSAFTASLNQSISLPSLNASEEAEKEDNAAESDADENAEAESSAEEVVPEDDPDSIL